MMDVKDEQDNSSSADDGHESWERSRDLRVDMLHAFTTSEMYDCSFKVGTEPNCKVFKCHKLILSIASSVFQAMFYGNFNEASKGRDDPIVCDEVVPEVFEAAMKFIYGGHQKFHDLSFAAKVLLFADKMHISGLISAVKHFMDSCVSGQNVLTVANIYEIIRGSCDMTEKCREVLCAESEAALDSNVWTRLSADMVKAILQMDELSIEEIDLFRALIRWAKAQVERDEGPADNKEEFVPLLRAKVEPFLKFIRFESMEPQQVAELFQITKMFTCEEQKSILLSSVLKDPKHLPQELSVAEERPARKKFIDTHVSYHRHKKTKALNADEVSFSFSVKKKVQLVQFSLSADFHNISPSKSITLYMNFPTPSTLKYYSADSVTYRKSVENEVPLYPGNLYRMQLDPNDLCAFPDVDYFIRFFKYSVSHPKNLQNCLVVDKDKIFLPVTDMRFKRI